MKIEKIKITNEQLKEYKANPNVKRRKILKGGYKQIVYASDQDLD